LDEVRQFSMECKWFWICPIKRFWEEGKLGSKWVEEYCKGYWNKCKRYKIVEEGGLCPDNMLPNGKIDKSLLE